jgi:hypothetical protein
VPEIIIKRYSFFIYTSLPAFHDWIAGFFYTLKSNFTASEKSTNCKDFHQSLCYTRVELANLTGVSEKKCPNLSSQSQTTY